MRVIGGRWRGRHLDAPEGRGVTRPTTDRVREAMASMVLAACGLSLTSVHVLDAFAGSGGLGIELLSRGAVSATFVEMNRKSAAVVRRNLTQLDVRSPEARVLSGDIFRLSARGSLPGAPFQIVLLDPPYATDPEDLAQLLASLMEHGSLTEGSLVLYERAEQNKTLQMPLLMHISSKRYVSTHIDRLRVEGVEQ